MVQIRIFERFSMGINGGAAKFLLTLATVFDEPWGVAALETSRYGLSSGIARWDHIFPRNFVKFSVISVAFPVVPGPTNRDTALRICIFLLFLYM